MIHIEDTSSFWRSTSACPLRVTGCWRIRYMDSAEYWRHTATIYAAAAAASYWRVEMLEPRMHRYVLKHSKGQRSETCGLKKSVPLNIFLHIWPT